jgi:CO/xanthine dehydrogenase Mo-binding subunit
VDGEQSRFVFTRRRFVKMSSMGGVWLTTRSLASRIPDLDSGDKGGSWSSSPGKARYRFEGFAKVTGQKIYARDFRFKDMSGWPSTGFYAMVLRSPYAGSTLTALELTGLPYDARPSKTITSVDLDRDEILFSEKTDLISPGPQKGSLFARVGESVQFMGQPVAILLFDDYWKLGRARKLLQAGTSVIKYAEPSAVRPEAMGLVENFVYLPRLAFKATHERTYTEEPQGELSFAIDPKNQHESPFYVPPTLLTRYSDGTRERFSQVLNGPSDPSGKKPVDLEAAHWRQKIEDDIRSSGWKTITANYETQQLDPMFMEPESGLAWYDRSNATLHLVIGTQSTDECVSDAISMFGAQRCPIKIQSVALNACYPGGGFGGRDVSTFSSLIAVAAAYSEAPVRMAYDRFEQFQSGIKQLGSHINQRLVLDSEGRFQAIIATYDLWAGGRNNYSQWVAQLAGYCGGSGYVIPRVSIDAKARPSIGVIAGSMRGFGGPQSAFAVESLIDEAAIELKRDPIELRRLNALSEGGYTVTGYKVSHSLRIKEICERAQRNPIWLNKGHDREKYLEQGLLYGAGFALANQAFGTGNDGVMATVELQANGDVAVSSNCIDMGNGSATSLAISTKKLGVNAKTVQLGQTNLFDVLKLTSDLNESKKPDWKNPRYTPAISLSSSSCITAFHQTHAVEVACRVLLENAIWPFACSQWKLPKTTPFDASKVRWDNGSLFMGRNRPLSLESICHGLYASGGLIAAMVHAAYLGQWIVGEFPVYGQTWRGPVDALAIRTADANEWSLVDRIGVDEPPDVAWNFGRSLYAPSATLSAVVVDPRTGGVKVLAVHSYLEAGRVVQPDLLMGQYYGGVAMGVGFAFHEECPQTDGGPGEGDWNLHRYHVSRWKDLPLDRITLELLNPSSPDEPPRGIAEAVLCPIAPALSNAVGSAIGKRFRSLPITANKILEALG